MISVAALTLGETTPSARFRVRQFIAPLAARGIEVREYFPRQRRGRLPAWPKPARALGLAANLASAAISRLPHAAATWRADVTWLSKQVVVGVPSWEVALRRPLILDVDDAMWMARPLGRTAAARAAARAAAVVVGNEYLAEWYRQYNSNVHVVPTSIDTIRFAPPPQRQLDPFVVGWSGSRATLPYLQGIENELRAFFAAVPSAKLLVTCDEAPRFGAGVREHVQFVPWSPESEVSALARMSVGIMPLVNNEISRGKCSFKMLQYMACGLPVVVSPVGSNADILALDDIGWAAAGPQSWVEALCACHAEPARAAARGSSGRRLVIQDFSVARSAEKLVAIFESVTLRHKE
jgi:glycosyltransferase involved in cell wall biosynthesis